MKTIGRIFAQNSGFLYFLNPNSNKNKEIVWGFFMFLIKLLEMLGWGRQAKVGSEEISEKK